MRRSPGPPPRLSAGLVPAAGLRDPLGFLLQRRRAQGLADRRLHRVELVIAGHLLDERATVVLEHDEVAQQRQEAALLEDALDRHLQLGVEGRRQLLTADGPPRLEPLPAGGERPEPRLQAVRYQEHRVTGKQRRQFRLVGLQLVERRPDGGVLIGRILELDHGQRQAIDEHHDVGPAGVAVLGHRELVDGRPRVCVRLVEVDHACLSAAHGPVLIPVLDVHPVHHHAVEGAIARLRRHAVRARQPAQCIVERLFGQIGVEPAQGAAHVARQHRVRVARAQRVVERIRSRRHVRAAQDAVVERPKPIEGRILHHRLRHNRHRLPQDEPGPFSAEHLVGADAMDAEADAGIRYLDLPSGVGGDFVSDDGAAMGERMCDEPVIGDLQERGDGGRLVSAASCPIAHGAKRRLDGAIRSQKEAVAPRFRPGR